MPGPVSQSHPGLKDPPIKERWQAELRARGFRYFVVKSEDVFNALTEREVRSFDRMLGKIGDRREKQGKPRSRSFWVFARHWTGANEVKQLIEKLLGHPIGEPY